MVVGFNPRPAHRVSDNPPSKARLKDMGSCCWHHGHDKSIFFIFGMFHVVSPFSMSGLPAQRLRASTGSDDDQIFHLSRLLPEEPERRARILPSNYRRIIKFTQRETTATYISQFRSDEALVFIGGYCCQPFAIRNTSRITFMELHGRLNHIKAVALITPVLNTSFYLYGKEGKA